MNIKYTLPVASTAFFNSPKFSIEGGRKCVLEASHEGDEFGNAKKLIIRFTNVEAFKCTYFLAIEHRMVNIAYDRLVDLGDSDWLRELTGNLRQNEADTPALFHLAIFFDDGPLYDFICGGFDVGEEDLEWEL
ncbi:MAG: hypothetical protein KDB79_08870 [Acidobacteria bacterium]|nr:hypothetical protein [Acidobacteriota bacterium]